MADGSHIEWTDATWNPITGCSVVSPGCANCYAMKLAGTRLKHHPSREGLTIDTKAGPVWNGQVRLNEQWLDQPLRWRRPRMIFVCAHGDLFHESVPDEWIDRVFAVMALSPQHTFQVLTKRSSRMRAYMSAARAHPVALAALEVALEQHVLNSNSTVGKGCIIQGDIAHLQQWPLRNVWLGISAEDQRRADERIPDLLETPAAVRFLSIEPLLGPIDFYKTSAAMPGWPSHQHPWRNGPILQGIHWVIVGGESGDRARPMHPDWARLLRDQCARARVPLFFKQWGNWAPGECANKAPTRTERVATLWSDIDEPVKWNYGTLTPRQSEEVHCDEEPDVYWLGKKSAGRWLDGVEHNAMPERRP